MERALPATVPVERVPPSEGPAIGPTTPKTARTEGNEGEAQGAWTRAAAAAACPPTRACVLTVRDGDDEDAAIMRALADDGKRWDHEKRNYVRVKNRTDDMLLYLDDGARSVDDEKFGWA